MLSSFVAANCAPDRRAGEAMMMGVVTGYCADKGSFDASSGVRRAGHGCHAKGQNGAN
jgi:hypothetical protein